MFGLSHRETTAHVAAREWLEVSFLLFGCAVVHQDFHVPDVRRLAVEQVMTDGRASELFADEGKLRQRESDSAVLDGQVRRPKSHRFDLFALCLQRGRQFAKGSSEKLRFEGISLIAHELFNPVQEPEQFFTVMIGHVVRGYCNSLRAMFQRTFTSSRVAVSNVLSCNNAANISCSCFSSALAGFFALRSARICDASASAACNLNR